MEETSFWLAQRYSCLILFPVYDTLKNFSMQLLYAIIIYCKHMGGKGSYLTTTKIYYLDYDFATS